MATQTLPGDVRPAKIARTLPALTKITTKAVDVARLHLRGGNPGASNTRQQRAIEAVITSDACERLFTRHPGNGCLLAREG